MSMHTPNHLGGFDFRSCGQECLDVKRFKEMIDVIRLAQKYGLACSVKNEFTEEMEVEAGRQEVFSNLCDK